MDEELEQWLRSTALTMESASRHRGSISRERFVVENGHRYVSHALTDGEQQVVEAAFEGYRRFWGPFEHRQCFANSQRLVISDTTGRLRYVEGFAWSRPSHPVLHGWVSIHGKVVDPTVPPATLEDVTLSEPPQVLGQFDARCYRGVPFLRSYLNQRLRVTGGWGTLIDDWEHAYPLLRRGRSAPPLGRWRARRH